MDTLLGIKKLYSMVTEYEQLLTANARKSPDEIDSITSVIRTEMQRSYPPLEKKIGFYGEYEPAGKAIGMKLDVFELAFDRFSKNGLEGKLNAINEIKVILNRAIGKLEAEGESWKPNSKFDSRKLKRKSRRLSRYQKIWKWIDKHRIVTIITTLAAIATIVGVILGLR